MMCILKYIPDMSYTTHQLLLTLFSSPRRILSCFLACPKLLLFSISTIWQTRWENYILDSVQKLYRTMNFLKRMLQSMDSSPSLSTFLEAAEFSSPSPLPPDYYSVTCRHPNKTNTVHNLSQIVRHFQSVTSIPAAIKTLTIMLTAVSQSQYDQDILEVLECLESPSLEGAGQLRAQWVRELTICMKSYLIKLPSVGDVLRRTLPKSFEAEGQFKKWLSDLYLLINLLGLLFPYLTNAFNTFGRYYLKPGSFFTEFYRVLSEQLLGIYSYLRVIVTNFLRDHKRCSLQELECFLKTLPEIELLCDRLEEVMLNKYFRGKGPSPKIYFKQEDIAEIIYYIQQCHSAAKLSNDVHDNTAEEQFGEYQV